MKCCAVLHAVFGTCSTYINMDMYMYMHCGQRSRPGKSRSACRLALTVATTLAVLALSLSGRYRGAGAAARPSYCMYHLSAPVGNGFEDPVAGYCEMRHFSRMKIQSCDARSV